MCGIVRTDGQPIDVPVLDRMRDTMAHRGPDDYGNFVDGNAAIASRRLSVIDVEGGHMPIHNEDETVWVAYNGEIYNYKELRRELEEKGHRFYTNTDTEVIVHAYEAYGQDCVKRFNGAFAFGLWDMKNRTLFLARDQLGQKPLYYMSHNGAFLFGSEIKAILEYPGVVREVESQALSCSLTLGYVPAPLTMFRGIRKLPAGHRLTLKNGNVEISRYWKAEYRPTKGVRVEDLVSELRERLTRSVESRLAGDVPLGALLSGGVDSTVIVGIMAQLMDRPVETFTIGFNEPGFDASQSAKFNVDQEFARVISERFQTNHHELVVTPADNLPLLCHQTIWEMEQPNYAPTAIPWHLLAQFASTDLTVALTGDGSDDLIGGHNMLVRDRLVSAYGYAPRWLRAGLQGLSKRNRSLPRKVRGLLDRGTLSTPLERYLSWVKVFDLGDQQELRLDHPDGSSTYDDVAEIVNPHLPPHLVRDFAPHMAMTQLTLWNSNHIQDTVDKLTMSHALEARAPFLDHTFVEFAMRVPFDLKVRRTTRKWLLKQAFPDLLPKEIMDRPQWGMGTPASHWLRTHLRPLVDELLSPTALRRAGVLDPDYVTPIVEGHMDKSRYAMLPVWHLLSFQLWHEMFIQQTRSVEM